MTKTITTILFFIIVILAVVFTTEMDSEPKVAQAQQLVLLSEVKDFEDPEEISMEDLKEIYPDAGKEPKDKTVENNTESNDSPEKSKSEKLTKAVETSQDGWDTYIKHAKENPFRGSVFKEGEFAGNHLQIAKELRMPLYEGIDGCHPYILASLHYSETGLQMSNGPNGQGAFQAYSSGIRYPANSYPDDFRIQAQRACDTFRAKVGGADMSSLDDVDTIGRAFALYNGCWSPAYGIYANGHQGSSNSWELCPYTANKLTNDKVGMLQCATDGCGSVNHRSTYGTMAFIAHLLAT